MRKYGPHKYILSKMLCIGDSNICQHTHISTFTNVCKQGTEHKHYVSLCGKSKLLPFPLQTWW